MKIEGQPTDIAIRTSSTFAGNHRLDYVLMSPLVKNPSPRIILRLYQIEKLLVRMNSAIPFINAQAAGDIFDENTHRAEYVQQILKVW